MTNKPLTPKKGADYNGENDSGEDVDATPPESLLLTKDQQEYVVNLSQKHQPHENTHSFSPVHLYVTILF